MSSVSLWAEYRHHLKLTDAYLRHGEAWQPRVAAPHAAIAGQWHRAWTVAIDATAAAVAEQGDRGALARAAAAAWRPVAVLVRRLDVLVVATAGWFADGVRPDCPTLGWQMADAASPHLVGWALAGPPANECRFADQPLPNPARSALGLLRAVVGEPDAVAGLIADELAGPDAGQTVAWLRIIRDVLLPPAERGSHIAGRPFADHTAAAEAWVAGWELPAAADVVACRQIAAAVGGWHGDRHIQLSVMVALCRRLSPPAGNDINSTPTPCHPEAEAVIRHIATATDSRPGVITSQTVANGRLRKTTKKRDQHEPSEECKRLILAVVRQKPGRTGREIHDAIGGGKTFGKLGHHLAWMVKHGLIVNDRTNGYQDVQPASEGVI